MNTTTELSQKIDELLAVLEKDIEHIQHGIEELEELRRFVIKRDDSGLSGMFEQIRSQSQGYIENQKQREQVRSSIARILDWPIEQVRLSQLQRVVSAGQAEQINLTRQRLTEKVSVMKSEHSGTVMLLRDLARFNGMLLNAILENQQSSGTTYNARGGKSRGGEVAFMNLHL